MSDFLDAQAAAMRARHLSPNYYGESISYNAGAGAVALDVHARHKIETRRDDDGNETRVEVLKVTFDRTDLATAPTYGHTVTRSGDARAYVFAGEGRSNAVIWKATFERDYIVQQGTP